MTPAALRTTLTGMLSDILGVYQQPNGSSTPAIWAGEPPSDWTAQGLEVRLPIVPNLDQQPAYHTGFVSAEYPVRVVSHGEPASHETAVRRILSRWADATATTIPADEGLGVLAQTIITIKT